MKGNSLPSHTVQVISTSLDYVFQEGQRENANRPDRQGEPQLMSRENLWSLEPPLEPQTRPRENKNHLGSFISDS